MVVSSRQIRLTSLTKASKVVGAAHFNLSRRNTLIVFFVLSSRAILESYLVWAAEAQENRICQVEDSVPLSEFRVWFLQIVEQVIVLKTKMNTPRTARSIDQQKFSSPVVNSPQTSQSSAASGNFKTVNTDLDVHPTDSHHLRTTNSLLNFWVHATNQGRDQNESVDFSRTDIFRNDDAVDVDVDVAAFDADRRKRADTDTWDQDQLQIDDWESDESGSNDGKELELLELLTGAASSTEITLTSTASVILSLSTSSTEVTLPQLLSPQQAHREAKMRRILDFSRSLRDVDRAGALEILQRPIDIQPRVKSGFHSAYAAEAWNRFRSRSLSDDCDGGNMRVEGSHRVGTSCVVSESSSDDETDHVESPHGPLVHSTYDIDGFTNAFA
jgi:hypothetical protein